MLVDSGKIYSNFYEEWETQVERLPAWCGSGPRRWWTARTGRSKDDNAIVFGERT